MIFIYFLSGPSTRFQFSLSFLFHGKPKPHTATPPGTSHHTGWVRAGRAGFPSPYKRTQSNSPERLPLLGPVAHEESTGLAHLRVLGSPETVSLGISEGEDRKGMKWGTERHTKAVSLFLPCQAEAGR